MFICGLCVVLAGCVCVGLVFFVDEEFLEFLEVVVDCLDVALVWYGFDGVSNT